MRRLGEKEVFSFPNELIARSVASSALQTTRALLNSDNPLFSSRLAIETSGGPASISTTRYNEGPSGNPAMLGVMYVRRESILVAEIHGCTEPSVNKGQPCSDKWCHAASIIIDGATVDSVLVTPGAASSGGYYLEKLLVDVNEGATGRGASVDVPVDPRADVLGMQIIDASIRSGHPFENDFLNQARKTLVASATRP